MFKKITIITIFISVYVEGLLVAHAQDLGVVPGSLLVMMSIFALTTLVGASAYYRRENEIVPELVMTTNTLEAMMSGDVVEIDDDDVIEIEMPEPFTYTDKIDISSLEEDVVEVEVVEDTDIDFTETIALKLPELSESDVKAADKELTAALNEEMPAEPAWTEEPKEASAETDKMINDLFKEVDDDGAPTLDPDVKVQSYVLEESVIEDEYIPIPEEDEAESVELELEDLMKTVSEDLDGEIDTTKVISVMEDGNVSLTLEELSDVVAEGLDANLVDDDEYDETIVIKDM